MEGRTDGTKKCFLLLRVAALLLLSFTMTHTPMTAATCPPHVSEYLAETIAGDRSHGFEIDSIEEAKSAQQQVLILTVSSSLLNNNNIPEPFRTALENGRGKLVLRIWRNCAKWWNLNFNDNHSSMIKMARAEVAAYRIAKRALSSSLVYIPTVLYFSHDENYNDNEIHEQKQQQNCRENGACSGDHPWALLEYVGPESTLFNETFEYTTKWVDEMITTRHEFGFDEPHPRWGRVPEEECLEYAVHVVDTIILPTHLYFFETEDSIQWSADLGIPVNNTVRGRRFKDMLDLYTTAHETIQEQITQIESDECLQTSVAVLKKCLGALEREADIAGLLNDKDSVPALLVHMDCQPQNLICSCAKEDDTTKIVSILDWEEAAYADPRFELLLLCRKVCASRQQATQLWDYYSSKIPYNIGPLEPWLKLETVHSITTLLLQCCNCGGRSPWETRNDLKGKLQREFARLHAIGWKFCEEIIK